VTKKKPNLPRSIVDGMMQQFELMKHLTGSDRKAIYSTSQRLLRLVSKSAVEMDNGYYVCNICGENTLSKKPEDIDHNEDCPLSWIDPIKL
jgi:hypothetical protein